MESKVAVLGDSDFAMAFSALGLDAFPVEADRAKVVETAEQIIKEKYGLVVVAENIAEMTNEVFEKRQKDAVPCVVVVPFLRESEGFATKALGKMLKAATGIDIL
jgi:V/A-type H+/Na+-transporting ATPase subunit F